MTRWLRRLAVAALVYAAVAVGALVGFVQLYGAPVELPRGATVIVLSGGQRDDGTMGAHTARRVTAAVAAFHQAGAARLVVTGTGVGHKPLDVAIPMAEAAAAAGVPRDRILIEPRARSTLQNALFSADLLGPDPGPVILVTNRFHLPRAWASFRWAGLGRLTPYPADTAGEHWRHLGFRVLLTEVAKIAVNAGRMALAGGLSALGVGDAALEPMLR